jgi:plastocyanin
VNASIQRRRREPRAVHGMLRLWFFGICGLSIIVGGACSRDSSGTGDGNAPAKPIAPAVASSAAQVSMRNLQFSPVTIEVKQGDVVEWKNDDLVPHTATSTSFDSGTIASGESWRHTFTNAGTFSYACTFHPAMKGVVNVK